MVRRLTPPLIFFAVLGWAALVLTCHAVLVWRDAKPSSVVAGATAELTCWYFTGVGFADHTYVYAANAFQGKVGCSTLIGVGQAW